jgi:long-chain acyl-CoA synthetase
MSSLRVCASGGAALPAELKDAFEQQSGAIVAEGYGLTECCITASNPYAAPRKVGTIGQPLPGTMFALVNRDDPTRPPPAGEPGEIVISGPQVMKGYWNRPGDVEGSFVNGAFRTGDVGAIDEDGFIRIVDRLKDMISVGGFKVYPSQVEAVLYRHPAVREAVVIGVVDPYRGEMPKAFVSLNAGADVDGVALKEWLNPQLGKHERVCAVEIRPDLPKTLVGKLSRKELVAEERAKVVPAA